MQHLVDTDWVISHLRGYAPVVRRLDSLLPAGVGMSIISLAELYDGILRSPEPDSDERALRDLIAAGIDIVDADVIAWFKSNSPTDIDCQTDINQVLREYVRREKVKDSTPTP